MDDSRAVMMNAVSASDSIQHFGRLHVAQDCQKDVDQLYAKSEKMSQHHKS